MQALHAVGLTVGKFYQDVHDVNHRHKCRLDEVLKPALEEKKPTQTSIPVAPVTPTARLTIAILLRHSCCAPSEDAFERAWWNKYRRIRERLWRGHGLTLLIICNHSHPPPPPPPAHGAIFFSNPPPTDRKRSVKIGFFFFFFFEREKDKRTPPTENKSCKTRHGQVKVGMAP